jgi:hypothetical protein
MIGSIGTTKRNGVDLSAEPIVANTAAMTTRIPFLAYARDFEIAYATDQWSLVERHFAPNAVHRALGEGPLACDDRGRDAVIAGLRRSVETVDRRFDARIPEIVDGPTRRDDGLWMRWRLSFRRAGLPPLELEGEHVAVFGADGKIARIDETLLDGADRRAAEYLARHDAALRPIGSAPTPLGDDDAKRFRRATLRSFTRAYACAKSQADVAGALAVCAPDFTIDAIPLGIASRDRDDTARHLNAWFTAFPDYAAQTESLAVSGDQVAWWGRMTVTSKGPYLGRAPTGKRADLPAFSVFDFRGGELARERFHFDLAAFCRALDFPLERP